MTNRTPAIETRRLVKPSEKENDPATDTPAVKPAAQVAYVELNKSREAVRQSTDIIAQQYSILQASSNYLSVIEQLPLSTVIYNTENILILANRHFYELLEIPGTECIGKHIQDVIQQVHTNESLPEVNQFIVSHTDTLETELIISSAGKSQKYLLCKSVLIRNAGGIPEKVITQFVDITQRKEEEELSKRKNAELEKFVYSTSHDLRAPLRSILGLIYIMQQESNPEVLKTYLDMIRSSVNRMDDFIKEIVDLSRNSKQPVNTEVINLKEIITQIFDSLRYIPGAEKIDFSLNIKQDMPFVSDVSRVKIILNNLISNAIAYHRLNQEKPFIQVQVNTKGKYCQIDVTDNGRGIKKEHQAKIFDMFYRASDDSKGSGLGLYIVKEAVQKLNGEIRIKSKWGEGTTFSVKLFNHCQ